MNDKIIIPFLEALIDIADSMAQLKIEAGEPHLKEGELAPGEVTGLIRLTGQRHQGSLAISFHRDALFLLYQQMLGEPLETIDQTALDLAGEITNMVCGGAMQRMASKGYEFELAQPSILSGRDHLIQHSGAGPVMSQPLYLERGKMFIEVCLNR